METESLLQQPKEGPFVSAIKAKEVNRKNLVLVKKKPDPQVYVDILQAIKIGACRPTIIVQSTKIPWISVMQCLRTLEQKGLISTGFDSTSGTVISVLTEAGCNVLNEKS